MIIIPWGAGALKGVLRIYKECEPKYCYSCRISGHCLTIGYFLKAGMAGSVFKFFLLKSNTLVIVNGISVPGECDEVYRNIGGGYDGVNCPC